MSTNNFHFENVLVAIDCDDWDTFQHDEFIESVQESLAKCKGYNMDKWDANALRSYGGKIIYCVEVEGAKGTYKNIEIVLRNGYYSGANLDYIISDLVDYDIELKSLEAKVERKCRQIEKILNKFGQKLIKVAQFSNGEAVYQKAK